MDPQNQQDLDKALDEYYREIIRQMVVSAFEAHYWGQIYAYEQTGYRPDMTRVNEQALEYSREYGKLLEEEGASIMYGQKTPWLEQMREQDRVEVARIIDEGIAQGKHPGTRQSGTGAYKKGTIGYELQQHFQERKSQATTVARTETGRIYNRAALGKYAEFGFDKVQVHDGEGNDPCDICKAVNGRIWSMDFAQTHELQHPNCVRAFSAYRGDKPPNDYV